MAWPSGKASVARVAVVSIEPCSLGAFLNLFGGQVAVVRVAGSKQFVRCGNVGIGISGLKVGAFKMGVVAVDANPCKCVDDALCPLRLIARFVGVLNAQHKSAVVLQRE